MDATEEDTIEASAPVQAEPAIKLRSYQHEMLEASLLRNVIVAMDTGSGKTQIAIHRIQKELERSNADSLVWFMCPSVALCEQQFHVLSKQLPGYLMKMLTGLNDVDKWTNQDLWDGVLKNVRVVVGTPKVLEDALTHGFVRMSRLALLVFDEAHRCIKESPMNLIMRNFYHPAKAKGDKVPAILGLTASPVISAKSGKLETIEANLDAMTITPKRHRSELESFVHPPQLASVIYTQSAGQELANVSALCRLLQRTVDTYDLSTDPYIIGLVDLGDDKSQRKLESLVLEPKTYCYKQLKALQQRSKALHDQLGPFAADWYVRKCMQRYVESVRSEAPILQDLSDKERQHLRKIFDNMLHMPEDVEGRELMHVVTNKVQCLIKLLQQHHSSSVRGIVFVEQRAAVTALAQILRSHPDFREKYSMGTFVGTSTFAKRKIAVADFVELTQQQNDLADFRTGSKNLMIATNVLEEGIDVTACNLVVCFDPPKNLVSFVQRRGRARDENSTYVLFLSSQDPHSNPSKWQQLEAEMKQAYMDEMRQLSSVETGDEAALNEKTYRIEKTQALLTLTNAKAHLYHFCAVSSHHESRYVDLRPEFTTTNNGGLTPWSARVHLPSFISRDLRTASSSRSYCSEATAIKDAAFESYVALHKAGLIDDNLLPKHENSPEFDHINRVSIIEVSECQSSWKQLFRNPERDNLNWHAGILQLSVNGETVLSLTIWLPTVVPEISSLDLYWNEHKTYVARISPLHDGPLSGRLAMFTEIRHYTHILLGSVFGVHMGKYADHDFPVMFSPESTLEGNSIPVFSESWQPALTLLDSNPDTANCGLIRWSGSGNKQYFFSGIAPRASPDSKPEIVVTTFPKRKDFLHPLNRNNTQHAAYTASQTLPIGECTVSSLPAKCAVLAAFVPSIMHRLELSLLARDLQSSILADVQISDLSLITEAITSPSANEKTDYNRLEFLGDCILKYCAALQVTAGHLNWPEGYLTLEKFVIVSNDNLTKGGLALGLDRFIVTKPFTGNKWRPIDINELLAQSEVGRREMSSKIVADVVEALIGAAYVDGGLDKAFSCIRTLIPSTQQRPWFHQKYSIERLLSEVDDKEHIDLSLLERLVGHSFKRPALLLEAVTHASYPHISSGLSYERLEFLGDAILELLIVPRIFAHPRKLKHWEMDRVKKTLVCGPYLGYCCMSYGIEEEHFNVAEQTADTREPLCLQRSSRTVHLHDFLRASVRMVNDKHLSLAPFEKYREATEEGLEHGNEYPWPELIAMKPQKFLSDMIESVLGALFLDTQGDLSVCEAFLEKSGILRHMLRTLDENVETLMPKEHLGIMAGGQTVEYVTTQVLDSEGKAAIECTVKIADVDVVRGTGYRTKAEAEARAAREGVRMLELKYGGQASNRKRKLDILTNDRAEAQGAGVEVN